MIGWCGFHTWYIYHYRAEIGYVLDDDNYKGKGIMTEAVKAIIDYGFSKMDLNRIEALVGADNIPSMKIIKSNGFKEEGVLREHYYTNNRIEDSLLFALLKKEYYGSVESQPL